METLLHNINFKDGLVPAVIIDKDTDTVLTLCYMNRDALLKSLQTGTVHLFRRSRGELMEKGQTSGHVQLIDEIRLDCAGNSLLIYVHQRVAACHQGYFSCFFRRYNPETDALETVDEKVFEPDAVY